ncbi:aminoglycoside phosphotransferase (APT) family kinase protein [Arthrobacter sp. SLBN-100]|uniref:phosphotransferase family protein n=1 Tax=Arthrobacter sp. SLBN-100 TaxID=2768450 RepID=UPI0011508700|nr:phosphotransferase family protein [Arthrobacter sp. SLBN-100]TQJ62064.1 aminoglycoside phosphotransferase (APT) family kinase protein [Arthrobacter sp. SLBN-100]
MSTPANLHPTGPSPDGLDLQVLAAYLAGTGILGPDSVLHGTLISGGKSNLTYRITDGTSRWILRRPPLGNILPGAHDVTREHRVMLALGDTNIPVPRMAALCENGDVLGAPFYLMEEVSGLILRAPEDVSQIPEVTRARLGAALVDVLADLHEVDFAQVGLNTLGNPEGYLERQLERWVRQYHKIKVRELAYIQPIADSLASYLPRGGKPAIVHGDYRLDNLIVSEEDPAHITAVLDWEMATLGDPLADLGILIMFWDEPDRPFNPITNGLMAAPGFMSSDAVTNRYINRRNLQIDSMDWYLVFAKFKLAIILEQIHVRHLRGETRGEGFAGVGDMVTALLNSAMDNVSKSPSLGTAKGRFHG